VAAPGGARPYKKGSRLSAYWPAASRQMTNCTGPCRAAICSRSMGISDKVSALEHGSREAPPPTSGYEEACDKRSKPQEVTSSGLDTEGSICNKRSCLT